MKLDAQGYRLGQYRTSMRILSTSAQAVNSRLFELRNAHASNIIVPVSLVLRAAQVAAGTAQENSLRAYKLTSITVVETTNTVTPTATKLKTSMPAPGAALRHLTVAGNVNGMTGGTITKDTNPIAILPYNVAAAINTTTQWGPIECFPDSDNRLPVALGPDEGLLVESDLVNVTTFGMCWYLDFEWAELSQYVL